MRRAFTTIGVMVTLGVLVPATDAAADDNRGTWSQQMACTPDVLRLCGSQIPDADRIVSCLRQNTDLLSRNCRAVFEANASMSSSPQGSLAPTPPNGAPGNRPPY
ncbi:MAG: hypothetical protein ACLP1D_13640 [Xanthobacteraceae bacterium]